MLARHIDAGGDDTGRLDSSAAIRRRAASDGALRPASTIERAPRCTSHSASRRPSAPRPPVTRMVPSDGIVRAPAASGVTASRGTSAPVRAEGDLVLRHVVEQFGRQRLGLVGGVDVGVEVDQPAPQVRVLEPDDAPQAPQRRLVELIAQPAAGLHRRRIGRGGSLRDHPNPRSGGAAPACQVLQQAQHRADAEFLRRYQRIVGQPVMRRRVQRAEADDVAESRIASRTARRQDGVAAADRHLDADALEHVPQPLAETGSVRQNEPSGAIPRRRSGRSMPRGNDFPAEFVEPVRRHEGPDTAATSRRCWPISARRPGSSASRCPSGMVPAPTRCRTSASASPRSSNAVTVVDAMPGTARRHARQGAAAWRAAYARTDRSAARRAAAAVRRRTRVANRG